MQIRSTLFPRGSRPCHASALLFHAMPVPNYALPLQFKAMPLQYTASPPLAFADQILSLPPLCAAMPIEA